MSYISKAGLEELCGLASDSFRGRADENIFHSHKNDYICEPDSCGSYDICIQKKIMQSKRCGLRGRIVTDLGILGVLFTRSDIDTSALIYLVDEEDEKKSARMEDTVRLDLKEETVLIRGKEAKIMMYSGKTDKIEIKRISDAINEMSGETNIIYE